MLKEYYEDIENSNISDEDKKTLLDFLEILNEYRYHSDKFFSYTEDNLRQIFQIAKINPNLQIEIWCNLPDSVVNNTENWKIFGDVLDNKFGEYINGIDKKTLIELLNSYRARTSCDR